MSYNNIFVHTFPTIFGGAKKPLLLNTINGAVWALSTSRKLNAFYSGGPMQVISNATVEDVGFLSDETDQSAIEALATTESADVKLTNWYDQSGNGCDYVQPNVANAPRLYNFSGSSFESFNSKQGANFRSGEFMVLAGLGTGVINFQGVNGFIPNKQSFTCYIVGDFSDNGVKNHISCSQAAGNRFILGAVGDNPLLYLGNDTIDFSTSTDNATEAFIFEVDYQETGVNYDVDITMTRVSDNTSQTASYSRLITSNNWGTSTNSSSNLGSSINTFSGSPTTATVDGNITEIVIWDRLLSSSEVTALRDNLKDYWGI